MDNRRQFLRNAGVLGLAVALLGGAGCSSNEAPSCNPQQERRVQASLEDLTGMSVERAAKSLSSEGVEITAEELVKYTRVVYHEGAWDIDAVDGTEIVIRSDGSEHEQPHFDDDKLERGFRAIARVIDNRWVFDNYKGTEGLENKTDGPRFSADGSYDSILTIRGEDGNHAFSCVGHYSDDFTDRSLKQDGSFVYRGELMTDRDLADRAYRAVLQTLLTRGSFSEDKDVLDEALFYKNPDVIRTNWQGTRAFRSKVGKSTAACDQVTIMPSDAVAQKIRDGNPRVECRIDRDHTKDYVGKIMSHEFFNVIEGTRTETVYDSTKGCTFQDGQYTRGMSYTKSSAKCN
ncbi:hypothetical protein HOD38_05680 [archaeon]|jgi:hypothetical protein|nr:hypothetical protein [archaeon]MBT4397732.1 hypothetical protein [archaeon]MBT4441217.1 hypothetical protein [archaeon]